jgi:hypothetical protein
VAVRVHIHYDDFNIEDANLLELTPIMRNRALLKRTPQRDSTIKRQSPSKRRPKMIVNQLFKISCSI